MTVRTVVVVAVDEVDEEEAEEDDGDDNGALGNLTPRAANNSLSNSSSPCMEPRGGEGVGSIVGDIDKADNTSRCFNFSLSRNCGYNLAGRLLYFSG